MREEDLRRRCAKKAMEYIKNDAIIGLGAGRNIACLIEQIREDIAKNNSKIRIVTPSDNTRNICMRHGIEVIPTTFMEELDVAFDGCGEVDRNFYASKGGGGVFTKEKIIGAMAKEYILLIDENKLKKKLGLTPSISLEVVKDGLGYVSKMVKNLGGNPVVRTSSNKDGYLISDQGNVILDIRFNAIADFKKLNDDLNQMTGVIGTSLFTGEVTKVIVAGEDGVRVLSKN
ncbi:MAG: ribose 5-phosphate isomerase A [Sporolactobacillus sp.]